jgi:hypothetical protein
MIPFVYNLTCICGCVLGGVLVAGLVVVAMLVWLGGKNS